MVKIILLTIIVNIELHGAKFAVTEKDERLVY